MLQFGLDLADIVVRRLLVICGQVVGKLLVWVVGGFLGQFLFIW